MRIPKATLVRAFSTAHHLVNFNNRGFSDRARIIVKGGDGGSGCSSFARTREGLGQPNGGNGGQGGDVFLRTNDQLSSFRFGTFHFQAGQGKNGGSDLLHGSKGSDMYIDIPPGTIVREVISKNPTTHEVTTRFLADLDSADMEFKVATGSAGGYGNRAFRTSDRPKASISTFGGKAEEKRLELELKMLADVGLVGYPNAGKSSLLGCISKATPKVAPYPFTTLRPHIGRVMVDDLEMNEFTMADLPGLVDGAHLNVGLGHEFLRHIERTRILLYVIDVSRPLSLEQKREMRKMKTDPKANEFESLTTPKKNYKSKDRGESSAKSTSLKPSRNTNADEQGVYTYTQDGAKMNQNGDINNDDDGSSSLKPKKSSLIEGDPVSEFLSLRRELQLYSPELYWRPSMVFLNKVDSTTTLTQYQEYHIQNMQKVVPSHWPLIIGSTHTRRGIDELLQKLSSFLPYIHQWRISN